MVLELALYTLLGLLVGSFLNVCIYRLPRGESIVLPRSHCPHCGEPVSAWHNIPLIGYLLLAGKCRDCGNRISLRYPAVELLGAASFLACASVWQFQSPTYVNSALLSAIIVLAFIDYDHQILPNVITVPGIAVGVALSPLQDPMLFEDPISEYVAGLLGSFPIAGALAGAAIGGGLLWAVAAGYELVRKRQGLGLGDVKMMAMVGAFVGWRLALLTVFAGSFIGSILGLFLVLFRGRNLQTKLAFGTFLGIGAALALFWGASVI
jgi:leader peptidase (prepilin peptidase)/N-methyltransferase